MGPSTNLVLEFLRCQLIMLHDQAERPGAFGGEEQHVIQDVQLVNQILILKRQGGQVRPTCTVPRATLLPGPFAHRPRCCIR